MREINFFFSLKPYICKKVVTNTGKAWLKLKCASLHVKKNLSSSAVSSCLSCSEFQVKALPHGKLCRGYHTNGCPDKHSPDSACSVDYSSSRLSSPDHPNEGKMQRLYKCIHVWALHELAWGHTPINHAGTGAFEQTPQWSHCRNRNWCPLLFSLCTFGFLLPC